MACGLLAMQLTKCMHPPDLANTAAICYPQESACASSWQRTSAPWQQRVYLYEAAQLLSLQPQHWIHSSGAPKGLWLHACPCRSHQFSGYAGDQQPPQQQEGEQQIYQNVWILWSCFMLACLTCSCFVKQHSSHESHASPKSIVTCTSTSDCLATGMHCRLQHRSSDLFFIYRARSLDDLSRSY